MKMYELLSSPSRWTQDFFARDVEGHAVLPSSPEAVAWCLIGALTKCYPDPEENARISDKMYDLLGGEGVVRFNDRAKHWQVLAVCKNLDI